MFVAQMDEKIQGKIREELEVSIRATGHYTEQEVQHHAQQGMDSKLHDLADTIEISSYAEVANNISRSKKKKYKVYGLVTASKFIGVFEANSKEDAEQKAYDSDESHFSLCYHCSREIDIESEFDKIVVEESDE